MELLENLAQDCLEHIPGVPQREGDDGANGGDKIHQRLLARGKLPDDAPAGRGPASPDEAPDHGRAKRQRRHSAEDGSEFTGGQKDEAHNDWNYAKNRGEQGCKDKLRVWMRGVLRDTRRVGVFHI